jgi:hypothetical protein
MTWAHHNALLSCLLKTMLPAWSERSPSFLWLHDG